MPLFNIDNRRQDDTGTKPCWNNFRIFLNDPLFVKLRTYISDYIDRNYDTTEVIDSNKLGSAIINKIREDDMEMYKHLTYNLHSSIFGMTLYNFLATDSRNWYFLTKSIDSFDTKHGSSYFKRLSEA